MKYHTYCRDLAIIKSTELVLAYTALAEKIPGMVKTRETWKKNKTKKKITNNNNFKKNLKLRGSEYASKFEVLHSGFLKWPWTHLK